MVTEMTWDDESLDKRTIVTCFLSHQVELDTYTNYGETDDSAPYEELNTKPGAIDWTIPWGNLELSSNILGKGNFGEVKEGVYTTGAASVKVAVKTLKGKYFFKQTRTCKKQILYHRADSDVHVVIMTTLYLSNMFVVKLRMLRKLMAAF